MQYPSRGRGVSNPGRGMAPPTRVLSPRGRGMAPPAAARVLSPHGRGMTPAGRGLSPRGRGMTPAGRGSSPRGRGNVTGHQGGGFSQQAGRGGNFGAPTFRGSMQPQRPGSGRGGSQLQRGRRGSHPQSTFAGRGGNQSTFAGRGNSISSRGMNTSISRGRGFTNLRGRGSGTNESQNKAPVPEPLPEFSTEAYVPLTPITDDNEPWIVYFKESRFSQTIAERFIEHGYNHKQLFPSLTDRELIETGFKRGNLMKWRHDYPNPESVENVRNSPSFRGQNVMNSPSLRGQNGRNSPALRGRNASHSSMSGFNNPGRNPNGQLNDKYSKYVNVPINIPAPPQHPALPPQINFEKMTPGPYADFLPGSHVWCYNTANDSIANGHVIRINPFQVSVGFGDRKQAIPLAMMSFMKFSQPFLPGNTLSIYHRAVKSWSTGQIMGVRPLTIAVFVNKRPVIIPQRHMHWLEFHHHDPKKDARAQAKLKGESYDDSEEEEVNPVNVKEPALKPNVTSKTDEDEFAAFFDHQGDGNEDLAGSGDDFAAFLNNAGDNDESTTAVADDDFGGFF